MVEAAVEIAQEGQQWVVRVTEAGKTQEAMFERQSSAESFAAGQRARLSLPAKTPAS